MGPGTPAIERKQKERELKKSKDALDFLRRKQKKNY